MGRLPDVIGARSTVESMFVDLGRILRDVPGPRDDTLDRVSGKLVSPVDDVEIIYTGLCFIRQLTNVQGQNRAEGGRDVDRQRWRLRLPVSAPAIRYGDIWVGLRCDRDPTLVGRRLVVVEVSASTLAVSRICLLQDEQAATRV